MTLLSIFIGTGIAVVALVVYSALVISSRQERLAQRIREENSFERAPYSTYSTSGFNFETSEELTDVDEVDEISELYDELYDDEIVFKFEKN